MEKRIFKVEYSVHRLDHFLRDSLNSTSRSRIEKYIKDGNVKVDGIVCDKKNFSLEKGSRIEINIPVLTDRYDLDKLSFVRLFEDEHLLIINKKEGISVHPGAGIKEPTISDYFSHFYPELKNIGSHDRPGIVHRLDKGTSGVLIIAKSEAAFHKLQNQFKKREIKKTYCAILEGHIRFRNGSVDVPLIRNIRDRRKFSVDQYGNNKDSRDALTNYSLRYQFNNSAYVMIKPHTGRTHQIRVHMSHLGNPVLGDELYGRKNNFQRLALHAYSISFFHPIHRSRSLSITAGIPFSFIDFFRSEIIRTF